MAELNKEIVSNLTKTADAVRSKSGTSTKMRLNQMPSRINGIRQNQSNVEYFTHQLEDSVHNNSTRHTFTFKYPLSRKYAVCFVIGYISANVAPFYAIIDNTGSVTKRYNSYIKGNARFILNNLGSTTSMTFDISPGDLGSDSANKTATIVAGAFDYYLY